ncbi:MAG: hypothetical protein HYR85_07730 [Planctomycetes bacterium]|nr:hypothetical protein [Planctomycetota bacterium]MBI3843821.1 hypothetical protein [Planctomycetota bacterium]
MTRMVRIASLLGALVGPWAVAQDRSNPPDAPAPRVRQDDSNSKQDPPEQEPADDPLAWELFFKSGRTVTMEVVEVRDESVVLTVRDVPGSQAVIPFSELSDYTVYELLASRSDPSSSEAHEKLGDWAMSRMLYSFALEQYAAAIDFARPRPSDELLEKANKASRLSGADALARGESLMEEGRLADARDAFLSVVQNDARGPAADDAREKLAEINGKLHAGRVAMIEDQHKQAQVRAVDDRLAKAADLRDEGDAARQRGFVHAESLSQAAGHDRDAIDAYARALRAVDTAEEKMGGSERTEQIDELRRSIRGRLADAYVDLGRTYMMRSSLMQANKYMGMALAIDPNNTSALLLRQSIDETAAGGVSVLRVRPDARMRIRNALRRLRRG